MVARVIGAVVAVAEAVGDRVEGANVWGGGGGARRWERALWQEAAGPALQEPRWQKQDSQELSQTLA